MPQYYRIIKRKYAGTPLSAGAGGARWNTRGVPLIYAGSNVSLVHLEFLCIKGGTVLMDTWSLVTLELPSDSPNLELEMLPTEWDSRPYPRSTQLFGRTWVQENISVALKVPSARLPIVSYPSEHNLLINPQHPNFTQEVHVKSIVDLYFNLNEWATGHN
jgi:RES domain-containing protein